MNYIVKPHNFDYNTNKQIIEELILEYPFLSAEVCGRTALGRGIFSLNIGNQDNSVIYAAGFHGSEWITSLALFLFASADGCQRNAYSEKQTANGKQQTQQHSGRRGQCAKNHQRNID